MIQQGINQLLTMAGVGLRLSPQLEKKRSIADIKKQQNVLESAREEAAKGAQTELAQAIQDESAKAAENLFMLDPTQQTLHDYASARYMSTAGQSERATTMDPEEETHTEAYSPTTVQESLAQRGMAQVEQRAKRRKFMDYLRSEQTSLGGTVGELPTHLQRAIAQQYSKSERKRLMNLKDKEDNNG